MALGSLEVNQGAVLSTAEGPFMAAATGLQAKTTAPADPQVAINIIQNTGIKVESGGARPTNQIQVFR